LRLGFPWLDHADRAGFCHIFSDPHCLFSSYPRLHDTLIPTASLIGISAARAGQHFTIRPSSPESASQRCNRRPSTQARLPLRPIEGLEFVKETFAGSSPPTPKDRWVSRGEGRDDAGQVMVLVRCTDESLHNAAKLRRRLPLQGFELMFEAAARRKANDRRQIKHGSFVNSSQYRMQ